MYKGIFWYTSMDINEKTDVPTVLTLRVECDIDGTTLENVKFSSKSGDNFNHKAEWDFFSLSMKPYKGLPFDYFPRGRVEIKNKKIKIFANPVIVADENAKAIIIDIFELEEVKKEIKWIADNSKHYHYSADQSQSDRDNTEETDI